MVSGLTDNLQEFLPQIYQLLRNQFGYLDWWPGETPFEVIVGAILTQNTSWTNVEKAIYNLKSVGALSPEGILALNVDDSRSDGNSLPILIKPSGYFNQKSKRLQIIAKWVMNRCQGDLSMLESVTTPDLRNELLGVIGIGPETADCILLYGFNRLVFVVDTYTKRSMNRIGICNEDISYGELQNLFVQNLDDDIDLYNDFHAQIVALGKYHCKPRPLCENCPLSEICKYGLNKNRRVT
ncbi:MAG: endonuclease III domain-containing protein [Calditrichaeota bacterium]|nr:endonuclease III domain-containing protein [Calditrichota bacterium]